MLTRLGVTATVLAVVVTAFSSGALAANQTVTALSGPNRFSPAAVTINQGEMVTWTNGSGLHNVQFDDGSFEQPATPSSSAWTVQRTFNTPGTFTYLCEQHGSSMSGSVTVLATGTPPPPGGTPPPPGTPPLPLLKVTLKVSDTTPLAGRRVRVFGVVRPARDGRKVQIQKRLRSGKFKTIATTRLQNAGADKSTYSLRLRVSADTVLRARVGGDDANATGLSRSRKLDVHRPA
jgi:plastocyanin